MIYTTQRRRFVYYTWDNGSRLDRVVVECTLSLHWQLPPTKSPTSYYRFHDLVRTCRISSFCTVAWQLARFQLTRRIARSLGDNWASCPAWLWPGTCLCLVACVAILYGRQAFEGRLDWNLQYSHWQRTGSYERFFQLVSNWLQLEETQIGPTYVSHNTQPSGGSMQFLSSASRDAMEPLQFLVGSFVIILFLFTYDDDCVRLFKNGRRI